MVKKKPDSILKTKKMCKMSDFIEQHSLLCCVRMMHTRTETVDKWYELTAQSLKCRNRFENSCVGRLDVSNCTLLLFWIFQTFFHPKKIKSRSKAGRDFNIIWIYRHTQASSARTGPPAPHKNILNTKWSLSNFGTLQNDGFYSSCTWWEVELRFPQETFQN